ncbi:hypothetical protein AB0K51_01875 [Kitasatospora sp. NPDC049285]|uniref:hypothetical protein n=1 Tax=Kitasatospora sp. NPDC049285 TaxID=3157096 RepID=UPI003435D724
MTEPGSSHQDGAALERKIRSTGRPWTVGDIAMVADGQWAVRTRGERAAQDPIVWERAADGGLIELTLDELARAVGSSWRGADRGQHED